MQVHAQLIASPRASERAGPCTSEHAGPRVNESAGPRTSEHAGPRTSAGGLACNLLDSKRRALIFTVFQCYYLCTYKK